MNRKLHLIIFKTNVATQKQVQRLKAILLELPLITQCNFDLDDCDSILRIVSLDLQPQTICQLLYIEGFNCETMESFIYS
ncbi:hypothetical protein [Pedobacter sp. L105]|uniref:hypothetical protein n=1 Tax=Pedobacter sp. L105 TaxID=1641871 RepID=UPI00131C7B8F|nr:hypothetical protein [Pedobacter sp. L105]